jgi:glycosyltransferase involved in cell wall biosynthesis
VSHFSISELRQKKLPSENEISASWTSDRPLVSIVCTTFNHERYIEDAIRGFLLQKTNFPFEIIIHDDASTDNARSIIKHYADAYPALIKAVFQNTNQYRLGKKPIPLAVGYSKAPYVAVCEGDDFWLDETKLQHQLDEMQKHPACDLSFHAAKVLHPGGELTPIADYSDQVSIIPAEEIISADGAFCPTASLVLKRKIFDSLPGWFYEKAPVGDYYLQVFGALSGGALYLPSAMAVYRSFASGSWSSSLYQKERNEIIAHSEKTMGCLSELDRFTDFKYSASINRAKSLQAFSIAILFLKKKYLKDSFCFMKMSWSSCRLIFISQLFVLSKKHMLRTIFGH